MLGLQQVINLRTLLVTSVETQMEKILFGATRQIRIQGGSSVIQLLNVEQQKKSPQEISRAQVATEHQ